MANTTINIPRPHLIMGLCLPLAVLIGYFLAEPMDSGSIAIVVLVLAVLSVPELTKPLLFLSAVIGLTMFLTGGFGLRLLGSDRYGGRGYLYLFCAVAGY